MTTDNASGAGMELPPMRSREIRFIASSDGRSIDDDDFTYDARLVVLGDFGSDDDRHDYASGLCEALNGTAATRLLAESQAQNAKLEANWRAAYDEKTQDLLAEIENGRKLEAQVERMRQALEFISEGEPYYLDMQERARAALKP